jgi:hypothetical protein
MKTTIFFSFLLRSSKIFFCLRGHTAVGPGPGGPFPAGRPTPWRPQRRPLQQGEGGRSGRRAHTTSQGELDT